MADAISIHAPAKGATQRCGKHFPLLGFQSTLPRRERPAPPVRAIHNTPFQSTLPRRERRTRIARNRGYAIHFNPRSREGSDVRSANDTIIMGISIHAPAKGATQIADALKAVCAISIHAPAKGATSGLSAEPRSGRNFNPRSREGSDVPAIQAVPPPEHFNPRSREGSDRFNARMCRRDCISIHAPAKGATFLDLSCSGMKSVFQSTLPRRERRNAQADLCHCGQNFNPRSREGSDGTPPRPSAPQGYFNPRSREGSDPSSRRSWGSSYTFQSTLPRRERHGVTSL